MEPPDFIDPRKLLGKYGLRPKRAYSQNFLVSRHAVDAIAQAARPEPGEVLVELGPGLGTLTAALMRVGARVVAVEPDPQMRDVLAQELVPSGLEVIDGDAATVDYAQLAARVTGAGDRRLCVVGNLPYAITGAILRNLTDQREQISRAVLMLQREVRDRLVAAPATPQYGALTVFTSAAFDIETVLQLSPGAFYPPPKVRSSVVLLRPRDVPRAVETTAFRTVVRAAFQARRKTLRNALAQVSTVAAAERALDRAGIDPRVRGETLSVEEFDALARAWTPA